LKLCSSSLKRWTKRLLKNRRAILGLITVFTALWMLNLDGWKLRTKQLEERWKLPASSDLFFYPIRFSPLADAEVSLQDILVKCGRRCVENPNLVFLGVEAQAMRGDVFLEKDIATQPALRAMQQNWPFPRSVWAEVCKRLLGAGARIVILDYYFPKPGVGDSQLKEVLEKNHDHIVAGSLFEKVAVANQDADILVFSVSHEAVIPELYADDLSGFVNFWVDPDQVVRRAYYRVTASQANGMNPGESEKIYSAMSAKAAEKMGFGESIPKEVGVPARFRFSGPKGTFYTVPLWQIFDSKMWKANFKDGEFFKDKVIIVGPTGAIAKDELLTPWGLVPGPELHLNAINAIVHNDFLFETKPWQNFLVVAGAALIAWLASLLIQSPSYRLILGFFLSIIYLYFAYNSYNVEGLFIPIVPPLLTLNLINFLGLTYEFILERIEKARVRSTFERYVSRNVVKEILDNREEYENLLGGQRKAVTILFSDIRGFTTMTESADSAALVERLNEYLTAMVKCVYKTDGTLDKFIGDAVMAVWGNVVSSNAAVDGQKAIETALDMLAELRRLNEKWAAAGIVPRWDIGIGLNHGEVIVGNMGATEKMEFTVIGDAVNLASRLESLTKEYGLELIIGESLAALVKDKFHLQSVDLVAVKGKTKPGEVFAVLGKTAGPLAENIAAYHKNFEEGIRLFRAQNFIEALEKFRLCEAAKPGDYLSIKVYQSRCVDLAANPPGEGWDGVHRMTKK